MTDLDECRCLPSLESCDDFVLREIFARVIQDDGRSELGDDRTLQWNDGQIDIFLRKLHAQDVARTLYAVNKRFASIVARQLAPEFVYRICHLCPRRAEDSRAAEDESVFAMYLQLCAPIIVNPDARNFAHEWRWHILYALIMMPAEYGRASERCAIHWRDMMFVREEWRDLLPNMMHIIGAADGRPAQAYLVYIFEHMIRAWLWDHVCSFIDVSFEFMTRGERKRILHDVMYYGINMFDYCRELRETVVVFYVVREYYFENVRAVILGSRSYSEYISITIRLLCVAPMILRDYVSPKLLRDIARVSSHQLVEVIRECDINLGAPEFESVRYLGAKLDARLRSADVSDDDPLFAFHDTDNYRHLIDFRASIMRALVLDQSRRSTVRFNTLAARLSALSLICLPQFFVDLKNQYHNVPIVYIDLRTWRANPTDGHDTAYRNVCRLRTQIELQWIALCVNGIRNNGTLFTVAVEDRAFDAPFVWRDRSANIDNSEIVRVIIEAMKHPKTRAECALRYCRYIGRAMMFKIAAQYHSIPHAQYYLQELARM